jgi:hypothetical protein
MKRTRLYLETSVFGFYFDRREVNRSRRDATQRLFAQIRDGIFEGYSGAAAVLELQRTEDEQLRDAMFDLLNDSRIQVLKLDTDLQRDVALLAE